MNRGPVQLKNELRHQDQDPDDRLPRRPFAIGDIHGCATGLRTLIEEIGTQPEDTIVVLGDVIDWGPDSRNCVQHLMDLSKRCRLILFRGNHEEMLFSALESESELRSWLDFGADETLKSYPYGVGTNSSILNTLRSSRSTVTITRPMSVSSSLLRTTRTSQRRSNLPQPSDGNLCSLSKRDYSAQGRPFSPVTPHRLRVRFSTWAF